MGIEISFSKEDNYILVEYSGEYSGNLASLKMDDVLKACDKNTCSKLLVDITRCKLNVSTVDRYRYAKALADRFIAPQRIKIATLVTPEQYNPFAKLVATNRGASYDIFTDKKEALYWLLK